MNKISMVLLALMSVTNLTYALNDNTDASWMVQSSLGMAYYSNATNLEGRTAIGRLSLGRSLFHMPYGQLGIEVGVQSGNTMHLDFSKESIDVLGGVPIEAQMKPMLDILLGFNTKSLGNSPFSAWLKGGMAYRTLQVDRESVNGVSDYSPEIQVGVGYTINERASINLGYQIIWGKQPLLRIDKGSETGVLSSMPTQSAVMIGFSYKFK